MCGLGGTGGLTGGSGPRLVTGDWEPTDRSGLAGTGGGAPVGVLVESFGETVTPATPFARFDELLLSFRGGFVGILGRFGNTGLLTGESDGAKLPGGDSRSGWYANFVSA